MITGKKTYIAPFVNAEKPQYLVIEDHFPNGRPALEKGFGVYLADRDTVNMSENESNSMPESGSLRNRTVRSRTRI